MGSSNSRVGVRRVESGWIVLAIASVVFAWFSHGRLYHSDLWGHLSYGRLICEEQALPETEPFMPLAAGVSLKATAWFSQVAMFQVWSFGGAAALQILYAVGVAVCAGILAATVYRRSGNVVWTVIAVAVLLLVNRSQLVIIRPQLAGIACFAALVWLVDDQRLSPKRCAAVVGLFAVWANLHPSFPAGLILLTLTGAGRAFDVARRTGSLKRAIVDSKFRRFTGVTIAAAAAVLANPYGLDLYFEVFRVSGNPNLPSLRDWQPLSLGSRQGRTAFAAAVVLVVLMWRTPRRVSSAELLVLVVSGAGAIATSRMLNWWAVSGALFVGVHGGAIWREYENRWALSRRAWFGAAMCCIAVAVAMSTLPRALGFGKPRILAQIVSFETPIKAGAIAVAEARGGLILSPNTWGDYLVWISGAEARPFVTSHVHLVPREIWRDYRTVSLGEAGCLDVLDKHGVAVILVGRRRAALKRAMASSPNWELRGETNRAQVFGRSREE